MSKPGHLVQTQLGITFERQRLASMLVDQYTGFLVFFGFGGFWLIWFRMVFCYGFTLVWVVIALRRLGKGNSFAVFKASITRF